MKSLISAAMSAALLLPLLCCRPSANAPQLAVISSARIHGDDSVLVFSPKGKERLRELPTLFLLHGFGGGFRDWSQNTDLQALSDNYGFRFVCPDGFPKSWYFNDSDTSSMQWRSFFWEDLYPYVASRYGLSPDKTFIDGLSMGGHGAMNIFLDHPELFKAAGSMSGILDLRHSGGSREIIPGILGAGSIDDEICVRESAVNRLGRIRDVGAEGKLMIVSCGTKDKFLPSTEIFEERCRKEGLRCIAIYSPAAHRWSYWKWALPHHLDFFREELQGVSR